MDLIKRLEAITEPDRELDAWIWLSLHDDDWLANNSVARRKHLERGNIDAFMRGWDVFWKGNSAYPFYTASIDAALALLPEEQWFTAVKLERNKEFGNGWHAAFRHQFFGHAPTAPVALCIAALKARAIPTSNQTVKP